MRRPGTEDAAMSLKLRFAAALALTLGSAAAMACGYCIEDRVAAVYDQNVVDGSKHAQRTVAFLSIEGSVRDDAASKRAVLAALKVAGAARGSARVVLANAACSLAFDPARTSLDKVVASANRGLAGRGMTLAPLRVIDAGGKLREP
jgi:hypothetical protein